MKRAILLGGPSLADFDAHIESLDHAQYRFYAINRKEVYERILARIGRSIDSWCVLSPPELTDQRLQADAFLAQGSGTLITSSAALEIAYGGAPPTSARIEKADDSIRDIYDFYHGMIGRPKLGKLLEADGTFNTLFVLLFALLRRDSQTPIHLFGCDGAAENYKQSGERIYYGMETGELSKRTSLSNIYADMENFELYWEPCMRHFGLDDGCIVNANPNSHYTVFKRASLATL